MALPTITAISREQLRSQMITSTFGRRNGLGPNDYEVGSQDTRLPVDILSSGSTATPAAPNGCTVLNSSSSGIWTLSSAMQQGIYKELVQVCTSTLGLVVQMPAGVTIISTLTSGSSQNPANQITFQGLGHALNLFSVTTATWVSVGAYTGVTLSTF